MLNSPIVSHLLQKMESSNENTSFVRVDSDPIETLIKKDDTSVSKLNEEEQETLQNLLGEVIPKIATPYNKTLIPLLRTSSKNTKIHHFQLI